MVYVLLADGFEEIEALSPVDLLRRGGVDVKTVSISASRMVEGGHGIRVEPCGHCGDGNIHTEMLRGPGMTDEEWKSATHASLTELYALSKELGGQLSGEHGIGNGRLDFLEDFVGSRMIQLYKSIKLAFDDKLILNPGKMIEFNK